MYYAKYQQDETMKFYVPLLYEIDDKNIKTNNKNRLSIVFICFFF